MRRLILILTGISLAFLTVCVVKADPTGSFNRIVVFGDSLSDTGNLYIATGGLSQPPEPTAFPPGPPQGSVYFEGRFSNGPVWVEHFATRLGLAELPPNQDEILPSNLGGANYAWGGAETGDGISARGTPNLGLQILQFFSDVQNEVQPPLDDQTLVVVWAGSNDFVNNSSNLPTTAAVVDNLAIHITTLAAQGGAKHFLVPNMPALGKVPRAVGTPAEPYFDFLSLDFNVKLEARLDELQDDLGITVIRFDAFALMSNIHFDPQTHGLVDVTGTVKLVVGEDPLTFFDPQVVEENPDDYMFFDDVHPTRVTFEIFGDFAFNAFGIGVLTQSLDPANPDAVELFGNRTEQVRSRLLKKLARVQAKIDRGKYLAAVNRLERFQTRVLDLANKAKIAQDDADDLIALAQQVIDCLSLYTG